MKLTVNLDEITKFQTEGGKLIFKKEAEDALLSLLSLKDKVEAAIEQAKQDIVAAGKTVYPNFKAVKGEKVTVSVREYGDRFVIEGEPAPEFVRQVVTERVDADAVTDYLTEEGKLPDGIAEQKRTKKVIISVKKDDTHRLP